MNTIDWRGYIYWSVGIFLSTWILYGRDKALLMIMVIFVMWCMGIVLYWFNR